jgi:hypothetical protein
MGEKYMDSVIEMVLNEMIKTEEALLRWKAYWIEILPEEKDDQMDEYLDLELTDKELFGFNIREIKWKGITTRNSVRDISFSTDGTIILSKRCRLPKPNKSKSVLISYEAVFNVQSSDFGLEIKVERLDGYDQFYEKKISSDCYSIKREGNLVIKSFNNMEISENLDTGSKTIIYNKKYKDKRRQTAESNATVSMEIRLNENNTPEFANISIDTHKGNGKINGSYRVNISKEHEVIANFYSRKGNKINMLSTPLLMDRCLMLASGNKVDSVETNTLSTSTDNNDKKESIGNRIINLGYLDFSMLTFNDIEAKINTILNLIKDDFPIQGLTLRLNECLDMCRIRNEVSEQPLKLVK